jgi:hypothetical protein
MPDHQQLSILRQVTAEHRDGEAEHPARKQYTILSSTWQANYHLVKSAGESAGQSVRTSAARRHFPLDIRPLVCRPRRRFHDHRGQADGSSAEAAASVLALI